jgi:hypothetical protein
MKQSNKAALFSLLVFPGSGHFLQKHYLTGSLLVCTVIACLGVLVTRAIATANSISDKILSGEIPLDIGHIQEAISAQSAANTSPAASIATWLLGACWLFSTVDAWRLGRRADRAANDGKTA